MRLEFTEYISSVPIGMLKQMGLLGEGNNTNMDALTTAARHVPVGILTVPIYRRHS